MADSLTSSAEAERQDLSAIGRRWPTLQPNDGNTRAMQPTRVLVVEDDAGLRHALSRGLTGSDMEVREAADGAAALALASNAEEPFDVIVLDIGLPDADGRDVCQAMRVRGVTALVLFLTARGQVGDQLSGFASGGDDYLTKPFDFAVLVARVAALARRARRAPAAPPPVLPRMDAGTQSLVVGQVSVALTPTEFRILEALNNASDRVVQRRELVTAAWPVAETVNDNSLDQYVARIRRKLTGVQDAPRLVTVHGLGYRLIVDPG
jgi:DNA-binding response OmpR family regulator